MKLRILGSGSKGNCYIVYTENTAVVVDSGISFSAVKKVMKECEIAKIHAIFITHEHADHIKSLKVLAEKTKATCYSSFGTSLHIDAVPLVQNQQMCVGDIAVTPFATSHDAEEPFGYIFRHDGRKLVIMTDTGFVPDIDEIKEADLYVIETNYDEELLRLNRVYHPQLKARIRGAEGHLSNVQAAEFIAAVAKKGQKVVAAHISEESNIVAKIYETFQRTLFERRGMFLGEDVIMAVSTASDMNQNLEV